MAKALQNGNLRMAILIGGFLVTIGTVCLAAGVLKANVDTLSERDKTQAKKIEHLEESYHGIQTAIAEMVVEQRHMNEGIKKLAGID